jgi:demethylmenaquinone methyltransferase/2-methoxy-6-polyprenyl-1,4-benzoquinol methylase
MRFALLVVVLASCSAGANALAGFGKPSKKSGPPPKKKAKRKTDKLPQDIPPLADDANKALRDANGDLNTAQALHFNRALARVQAAEPALFDKIAAQRLDDGDVHAKLVELTWDTIAAFSQPAGEPAAEVSRRLDRIARACCHEVNSGGQAVLDVGCGDGAALPFLESAGAELDAYVGLDLSRRMLDAARRKHSAVAFEHAGFDDYVRMTERRFDAVLFNGSLQFFADQEDAIARAAALLGPREGSRVVIAHANGGAFVRDEARGNPATVRSTMPSLAELRAMAERLGLRLDCADDDAGLDDFYLVALEAA